MLLLSASFLLGACSTKGHEEKMKTQKEAEDEFVATLTAADSSAVLTLCTQCMDLLKAKETDKALDMLYSIDDAGIAKPLTIQQREALTKRFQRFPVIRYRLDYLSFSTQGNNDVKYKIEFTPRSDSDTPGSSMGFMFNPIKANGEWVKFQSSELAISYKTDKITITSDNRKWINCDQGIFIFNEKGTIDDKSDDESKLYTTFTDANGSIDVSGYYCVVEDKTGQVWIGTSRGPIICRNPRNSIDKISCERIVRTNNENGEPFYLLDGEKINAIAVDGGNRKWIGTQSSGVFLVSEDGMETIYNFTTANSPLPSNQVNTLAINQQTGEVFIGTEKGLVSYMGDATEGSEDYSDIYAYPNPVRPEQNDRVTIVGLMNDSNVKITDLKGNIIYQGKSAGGTFTWDCRRKGGGRVATGIYLVLSATPEAKESVVTKIMVVK